MARIGMGNDMRWFEFKGSDPVKGKSTLPSAQKWDGWNVTYTPGMLQGERFTPEMADPNGMIGVMAVLLAHAHLDNGHFLAKHGIPTSTQWRTDVSVNAAHLPRIAELAEKHFSSHIITFSRPDMKQKIIPITVREYCTFFVDCRGDRWSPFLPTMIWQEKGEPHSWFNTGSKHDTIFDYMGDHKLSFAFGDLKPHMGRKPYTLGKETRRIARETLWEYARQCLD